MTEFMNELNNELMVFVEQRLGFAGSAKYQKFGPLNCKIYYYMKVMDLPMGGPST